MEFAYDGGGLGKGGTVTLYIDGEQVGEGKIAATVPMIYSGDETCDIGYDSGTPVADDYTSESSRFNGKVKHIIAGLAEGRDPNSSEGSAGGQSRSSVGPSR